MGDDALAEVALGGLSAAGVDTAGVARVDEPTGVAVVTVDATGENSIVVAPGANRSPAFPVDRLAVAVDDVLLVSTEVAPPVVERALAAGRAAGATTVLAAGPADEVTATQLALADHVVCNRHEVEVLGALLAAVPGHQVVVVTAGADGAVVREASGRTIVDAPHVEVVDTVGAGDCFAAAYAVGVGGGSPPVDAAARAAVAAALAVTGPGARHVPTAAEVDAGVAAPGGDAPATA